MPLPTAASPDFYTFSPLLPPGLRQVETDQHRRCRVRNTTDATYYPDGTAADADKLETLATTTTTGGVTGTETFDSSYVSSGENAGMLSEVVEQNAASNVDGGAPVTVQTEEYAHYSTGDNNGMAGQLRTVNVLDASGDVTDSGYYRWNANTSFTSDGGALKASFGSAAYARLQAAYPGVDPDTPSPMPRSHPTPTTPSSTQAPARSPRRPPAAPAARSAPAAWASPPTPSSPTPPQEPTPTPGKTR